MHSHCFQLDTSGLTSGESSTPQGSQNQTVVFQPALSDANNLSNGSFRPRATPKLISIPPVHCVRRSPISGLLRQMRRYLGLVQITWIAD